jgi:hypothetical protein
MFVKHLQEYLDKFTEGPNGRRGNAVSHARIYIATPGGYLEEIKRIEVHESNNPKDPSIIEHLGSGTVKLFRGSRIMELEACGFKLDACRLGLDACRLELEACGL